MGLTTILFLVISIGGLGYLIHIYNRLVALKINFENAFSQIEIQLKRRYDLIPNLVEVAKKYMDHERETLESIVNARNQAVSGLQKAASDPANSAAISQLASSEGLLKNALSKFSIVVENYPDLKASENMLELSDELTDTENRLSIVRQAFNDAVTSYNTFRQSFPNVMLASIFGHSNNAKLLEFADREAFQEAPKIEF